MGKINAYPTEALPKLNDKLVGTSVGGTSPQNGTYNFTPAELLQLFQQNFNAQAIVVANVPVYANNEAALLGGLTAGQFYRTDDYLKLVQ